MTLSQGEHYELMNDLEDKLGKKTAVRLAEALPPFDWNELARQAEVNSKIDALDARLSGKIDALDGRLSGEVNALKHEVAAQAEVMRAGFAEIGSRLDAMEHKMMHRVYRTMFAAGAAVVAIMAAIVT